MNQLTTITRRFVRNGKHRSVRGAYFNRNGKRVFMRAGDMVGALIAKEAGHLCADGTYIEFSSIRVREVAALPTNGTVANIELTINAGSISLSVDGSAPASSGAVTMPTLASLTTHKICSDATPANWANGALAYIGISN